MAEGIGLFASLRRVMAGLLGIVSSRVELIANEWEEERLRLTQALLFGLLALFSFCMGILFLAILVVLLFWQNHPLLVVTVLMFTFFAAAVVLYILSSGKLGQKPALFADTLAELKRDITALQAGHEHE